MMTKYNQSLQQAAMALLIMLVCLSSLSAQDRGQSAIEPIKKIPSKDLFQDGRLLTPINNPTRDSAQEKYFRALIGQEKSAIEYHFFEVNQQSLRDHDQFILNLPGLKEFNIFSYQIEDKEDGRIFWKGSSKDGLTIAKFILNGDMVTGYIQTSEDIFKLHPLTGKLHLLLPEKYSLDKDCGYGGKVPSKISRKQSNLQNPAPDDIEPREKAFNECKVRLMVVYTNAVDNESPNIADFIELEIDNFNDINANSDVDFQVELARSMEVNYTETDEELQHPDVASWDVSKDLYRIWHPTDGWMDNVHAERNLYDADMVMFLVNDLPGYGGLAFNVGVNSADAFCTMIWDNGNNTFSHEFGHLVGMWHNPENSPDPSSSVVPFSYGYGHYWTGAGPNFRTVMSYGNPCGASGCPRIMYWSTPDLDWGPNNIALGTATRNNARVAREQQNVIAGFQGTITNKSVFNNTYVRNREAGNIIARSTITTSNNTVRYYNGSSGQYTAGDEITFKPGFRAYSGSNFRATLGECNSVLSLQAAEKTEEDITEMEVTPLNKPEGSEGISSPSIQAFEVYPNPVINRATIRYVVGKTADVQLNLYDLNNRLISTFANMPSMEKGVYTAELNSQGLAAGMYLVRLMIGDQIQTKKVVISRQ